MKRHNTASLSNLLLEPGDRWLDKQDILLAIPISQETLANWRKRGWLPYYHLGGKILFKQSEFIAMIEKYRKHLRGK